MPEQVERWEGDADFTRYVIHVVRMVDGRVAVLYEMAPAHGRWMTVAGGSRTASTSQGEFLHWTYVAEKLYLTSETDARNLTMLIGLATASRVGVQAECPSGDGDHRLRARGPNAIAETDARNLKMLRKKVATEASKVLRDDQFSKTSKSVAGSDLSQKKSSPKKK